MSKNDVCPKCATPRERAEPRGACPTCGLRLDLWATFDAKTQNRPAPHAVLDPAFAALTQNDRFDDPNAHDAFIALARTEGQLDAAAARYRQAVKDSASEAHPQVARALTQIAFIATQESEAASRFSAAGSDSDKSLRVLKIAATVVAFFLFCVVGVLLGKGFRR